MARFTDLRYGYTKKVSQKTLLFVTSYINLLCAYRKIYNAEHALIRVTEILHKTLDSKGVVGMISMDLSKAFDCMPQGLLIAKLNA